jgi:hypothetical protein
MVRRRARSPRRRGCRRALGPGHKHRCGQESGRAHEPARRSRGRASSGDAGPVRVSVRPGAARQATSHRGLRLADDARRRCARRRSGRSGGRDERSGEGRRSRSWRSCGDGGRNRLGRRYVCTYNGLGGWRHVLGFPRFAMRPFSVRWSQRRGRRCRFPFVSACLVPRTIGRLWDCRTAIRFRRMTIRTLVCGIGATMSFGRSGRRRARLRAAAGFGLTATFGGRPYGQAVWRRRCRPAPRRRFVMPLARGGRGPW